MKKRHYISLAIILAGLVLSAGLFLFPRQLPAAWCSAVYREYRNVDGIEASFIKGFHVNDTVCVDVTALVATSDSAWALLKKGFAVVDYPEEVLAMTGNLCQVEIRYAPKGDHSRPVVDEPLGNDIVTVSRKEQTVCVFHIENEAQEKAIFKYNIYKLKN